MQVILDRILVIFICCKIIQNYAKSPNVLLIIVDDLRFSLSIYNEAKSYMPNIGSLSRKSFVFTNAYAQVKLGFSLNCLH